MLEAFRRDGGLIVDGMFNRATIGAMTAAADRRVPEFPPGSATQGMGAAGAAFVGANTVRFSSLPLLDDAYFDMLDNEIFAAIADAVLLPHCGSYWVNTGQIMYIGPGEAAQVLHRDADNWWEYVRSAWPNVVDITISAMIGLEEVTEELGATRSCPAATPGKTSTIGSSTSPFLLNSARAMRSSTRAMSSMAVAQTSPLIAGARRCI